MIEAFKRDHKRQVETDELKDNIITIEVNKILNLLDSVFIDSLD